jgi:hypothetical protein
LHQHIRLQPLQVLLGGKFRVSLCRLNLLLGYPASWERLHVHLPLGRANHRLRIQCRIRSVQLAAAHKPPAGLVRSLP